MNGTILNSWKDIAQYVGRGVRTVQRWERECGLPVHRPHNHARSPVVAIPTEIDNWLRNGSKVARANAHIALRLQLKHIIGEIWATAELVQRNRELMAQRLEQLRISTTHGLPARLAGPVERSSTASASYRRPTEEPLRSA